MWGFYLFIFFFEEQIVGFDEIRDVFFFEIIYVVNGGHCGTQKENI